LHRLDREHGVSIALDQPADLLALREQRDHWLEKSSPGFPAHVLGL